MRAPRAARPRLLALLLGTLPGLAAAQLSPLPPIPDPSAFERELSAERSQVRRIRLEGARAVAEAEWRAIVQPYEGRALGEGDLREIERRLTQLYLDRGFVSSGVLLAARAPGSDEVVFTAVEGTISQVRFRTPPRYASPRWLAGLLVPRHDEAVRTVDLQERMAILRDTGVVERINAELAPLPAPGMAELVVSVEERPPWSVELRYDNHHSPVVGARRASLWVDHRNVTGWGDRFDAHVGDAEGKDFHVAYSAGPPRSAWRFGLRYERSDALAIDPPEFRVLEIASDASTRRVEASNALVTSSTRSLTASLALERRSATSTLLGLPFSFIPGLADGITEIEVARLATEHTAVGPSAVLFLRGQWSEGRSRRAVDAVELAPASRFRAFAAQAQYARRISEAGAQVLVRVDSQYAPETLFPIEKKSVGGAESVRGYRESVLLRDSAVVGTIEARWPVYRHDAGVRVSLAAFVDGAYARDAEPRADEIRSIASAGVGLAAALPFGFSARIDYARPNRRWLTDDADSQDRGLHFRIAWTWPTK